MLDQSPPGGSKVKQTTKVVLTVSASQTSVSVPSVVGQTPTAAGAILNQAHLNVGGQTGACSDQYAGGLVSAQNPGAGQTVPPNTAVSVVISTGRCATVPGVVGQDAVARPSRPSRRPGLVANTTFDTVCPGGASPGFVDAQNPAGQHPGGHGEHGHHLGLSALDDDDLDQHDDHEHDGPADHDAPPRLGIGRSGQEPRAAADGRRQPAVGVTASVPS